MPIRIDEGIWSVRIEPEHGAMLSRLAVRTERGEAALLRDAEAGEPRWAHSSMYLLAPWSNRIAGARFGFAGEEHELRPDFPDDTAIHGIAKDHPFRILDRSPVSARLAFDSTEFDANFPFRHSIVARYEVDGTRLICDLEVKNTGDAAMPAGCGFHPFFARSLFDPSEIAELRAPVTGRYPAEGCIPTGKPVDDAVCAQLREGVAVSELDLDDCFAGFGGEATVTWPESGVRAYVRCSSSLGHAVIYTPKEGWFCFEPVTNANDGFNLHERGEDGTGVVVLKPGESLEARMEIEIKSEGSRQQAVGFVHAR